MGFFLRLSFTHKLLALLLPPLLGLIYFALLNINDANRISSSASDIQELVKVAAQNSLLVHELQKERGATAGFLGSQGKKFGDILRNQRRDTDQAASRRSSFLQEHEITNPVVARQIEEIASHLRELSSTRSAVDGLNIATKKAIGYYTGLNTQLLNVTSEIAQLAEDGDSANQLQAYYNFLQGKERAGIERAVMSNVFSVNLFTPGMFQRFVELVTEQNTYLNTFTKTAQAEQKAFYEQEMRNNAVNEVLRMRQVAYDQFEFGGFNIDSTDWFKQATGRINQLKSVEDRLASDLLALTEQQATKASATVMQGIIITLIMLAIVLGMAYLLTNIISRQLKSVAYAVTEADKNKMLNVRAEVITQDELGATAQSINNMLDTFEAAVQEIGKNSIQLAAISEETSLTVENNRQQLDQQKDETTLVAAAVEEMSATVQEVASSTSTTADAANEVDRVTTEGVDIVTDSMKGMNKLSGEMDQANQLISQLNESSNNITAVIDVIKSVAEQTNLLALNAAIEAARAGEQGRGFAVVADEVRTLAQRTQESTGEIESLVSKFQADASSVLSSIEQCSAEVTHSVETTHTMENKLGEIRTAVNSIKDMCNQIATAAEEQVSVTNEISQNVTRINEMADTTSVGGSEIAGASREQAQLASGLQSLAGAFTTS